MRLLLMLIILVTVLPVQADAFAPGAPPHGTAESPPGTRPEIAAHFEVRTIIGKGQPNERADWYLLRAVHRIQTIQPDRGVAEVWERHKGGALSLKRIFHADRRVVEYMPGELRARHVAVGWTALGAVIDPAVLARLQQRGVKQVPQGVATVYQGTLEHARFEVWWLPDAVVPARVLHQAGDRQFSLQLKALHNAPPPHWPQVSDTIMQEYLVIDAADLGDRHGDPFVKKIEGLDTGLPLFRRRTTGHRH
jgi:hypothetical protein